MRGIKTKTIDPKKWRYVESVFTLYISEYIITLPY